MWFQMENLNNNTHAILLVTLHMLIYSFVHILQCSINFCMLGNLHTFCRVLIIIKSHRFPIFLVLQLECQTVWIQFS